MTSMSAISKDIVLQFSARQVNSKLELEVKK